MPVITLVGIVLMIVAYAIATTQNPTPETAVTALILYTAGLATPIVAAVAEIARGSNR